MLLAQPHNIRPSNHATGHHVRPTVSTDHDPPTSWNPHVLRHSTDASHQPRTTQPSLLHGANTNQSPQQPPADPLTQLTRAQSLADGRDLAMARGRGVSQPPAQPSHPSRAASGTPRPPQRSQSTNPSSVNRWGHVIHTGQAPQTVQSPRVPPRAPSSPPPPRRPRQHDPRTEPGQGSNATPLPHAQPPPPPPHQEPRGRTREPDHHRGRDRQWTPSRDPSMRDVPVWRQRIQAREGRPKFQTIIPYTEQGRINQRYRTDNATR